MSSRKRSIRPNWGKRNIMIIDIIIMLFFVLAIFGMIVGYKQHDNPRKVETGHIPSSEVLSNSTGSNIRKGGSGMARYSSTTKAEGSVANNASTSQDELSLLDSQSKTSSSTNTNANTSDTLSGGIGQDEKVRFKDVTTNSYTNMRLGFVMELPANWRLLYEHSDEVLFVSDGVKVAGSLDDVRHTPKAMWISVGVSCVSANATSTSFALINASTTPTRERYACVPPLKINMGVRADQTNLFDHQAFLLDIERTIYPIVR